MSDSEIERFFNSIILKDRDLLNSEIIDLLRELQEEDKRASLLSLENDYGYFDVKAKNLKLRQQDSEGS